MKTFHFVFIKWGADDVMKKALDDRLLQLEAGAKVPVTVDVKGVASNAMGLTVLVALEEVVQA